jgi:hypothetical protein
MAKQEYKRLARARARGRFAVAVMTRTSLWLGSDHLLFVESNGYAETYKRFYFRDIQAFTLQRTNTVRNINIVLGVVTFMFAFFGLVVASDPAGRGVLLVIAGLFGLVLLFHAIPGTSCTCQIKTAVQTEELSALSRLRAARKALDRIRPLIATAQGGALSPDTIPELLRQSETAAARGTPEKASDGNLSGAGIPPRLES